jgi:hypothetical protein
MPKKRRKPSRPKGALVKVKCRAEVLAILDAWRKAQPGGMSRPQAISCLTELGLGLRARVR